MSAVALVWVLATPAPAAGAAPAAEVASAVDGEAPTKAEATKPAPAEPTPAKAAAPEDPAAEAEATDAAPNEVAAERAPTAPAPATQPAPAGDAPDDRPRWRLGGGFDSGQWRLGDDDRFEERRLNGFRAFAEWLPAPWRVSVAYRLLNERVEDVFAAPATEGDTHRNHALAALGGYDHRWFHLALGAAAWRGVETAEDPAWLLRPAGRLRAGPADLLYLEASAFDFTHWSLGPGAYKAGLGAQPGGARLFLGLAADWNERLAFSVAGAAPLGGDLTLHAGAGVDAREPGYYLLIEAGLSVGWR
ncbi:MAG: hypothetical protein H6704_31300 [Myxococcales bacterium]|nr:hypothetical protein [Myxococcales bacterium]